MIQVPKCTSDSVIYNDGKRLLFKVTENLFPLLLEIPGIHLFCFAGVCIVMFSLQSDYMLLKHQRKALLHILHIA